MVVALSSEDQMNEAIDWGKFIQIEAAESVCVRLKCKYLAQCY